MAKIENSVMEFLNHISREIGKYKDDIFNGNCYCDLTDKSNIIESPITGKEITSNPMKVAAEIFCYLFDWKIDGVYLDSNTKD